MLRGFTLLEVLIALVLFAGVLLGVLGTGQLILASAHDSGIRLRAAAFAASVLDSLRSGACARLTSGSASRGALTAAWTVTDKLDFVQIQVAIGIPRRAGPPRVARTTAVLACLEP